FRPRPVLRGEHQRSTEPPAPMGREDGNVLDVTVEVVAVDVRRPGRLLEPDLHEAHDLTVGLGYEHLVAREGEPVVESGSDCLRLELPEDLRVEERVESGVVDADAREPVDVVLTPRTNAQLDAHRG